MLFADKITNEELILSDGGTGTFLQKNGLEAGGCPELMNIENINEWINSGMNIGSHSHNHNDLTKLKKFDLENDLEFSKKILEDKFGQEIENFCYPFGKVNKSVYEVVEKKFKRAVTINRSRYETNKHNFLLIPRIDMGKNLSIFKIFLKTETFYEDIKYKQNELYL